MPSSGIGVPQGRDDFPLISDKAPWRWNLCLYHLGEFGFGMSPKSHMLKASSLGRLYWEVVEPLRGGLSVIGELSGLFLFLFLLLFGHEVSGFAIPHTIFMVCCLTTVSKVTGVCNY
jgi:hypothetical protein